MAVPGLYISWARYFQDKIFKFDAHEGKMEFGHQLVFTFHLHLFSLIQWNKNQKNVVFYKGYLATVLPILL